ncbi:MAG: homocysteine S-methyltransferase [Gammaproteobacteria bacterium]|nr:homocysteine S-methyltransferase [Gammaproteobacteria bacterium]
MLLKELARDSVVVVDGGLITQLKAQGFELDGVLWSAELLHTNPQALVDAHKAYLEAGAEVIISASYQASRAGFHQVGIDAEEADRLIASSVTLARRAVDEFMAEHPDTFERYVAASIGPYGAVLNDGSEYRGNYGVPRAILRDFHTVRLQVLDEAGADILACETIPSAEEAIVLGELLADASAPAWMTFSCRDGEHLCGGARIDDVAAELGLLGTLMALGVNCTPPQFVTSLIGNLRRAVPNIPIVVYPNSGESFVAGDNCWEGDRSLDDIVGYAREWHEAGASLIGGCCRVGPAEIQALADAFQVTDK